MSNLSFGEQLGLNASDSALSALIGVGNTFLGNYLGRKNEKKSLARQYKYAEAYAKNSPSWSVQGLRKAGLNPILAATDGAFSSPTVPNVSPDSPTPSSGPHLGLLEAYNQTKLTESQAELQQSQAKLNGIRAVNELKNMGFSGDNAVYARILSDLGFNDNTVKDVLSSIGGKVGDVLTKHDTSSGSGSSHEIKTRHVPKASDDLSDYMTPSQRSLFENMLRSGYSKSDALNLLDTHDAKLKQRIERHREKHPHHKNLSFRYR